MKSLKQIIKETVAEPKSSDEKRFKELHTKNVNKKDYPVDSRESEKVTKKKPRSADYSDGSDKEAYDTSYEKIEENAWEEIPMMERQLRFISYAAEEITEYLVDCDAGCVDPEEWFQNKLAHIHGQMRTLHAYIEGDRRAGGMYEETDLNEDVMQDLEKIVKTKSRGEVKFKDGDSMKVDMQTANVLLKLHGALNDKNKQTFANDVNKDEVGFMKMVDFAWSKVK